ncbi:MAG: alpha-L-rhamnosidase, partial [Thermoprotei archaeon]
FYVSPDCQTCNALPLASGMAPSDKARAIFETLVRDVEVEKDRHLNTGIVGTKYLLPVLSEHGRPDLAYAVATQTSYPSWGYMIREGATTLWERWELLTGSAMNSHNHHMLGTVDIYFYRHLAGIRPLKPGFREFAIKPDPVGPERVEASVRGAAGRVSVKIYRNPQGYGVEVHVPVSCTALIYVPTRGLCNPVVLERGKVVWRNGKLVARVKGVLDAWAEEGYIVFKVGSGHYSFRAASEPCAEPTC